MQNYYIPCGQQDRQSGFQKGQERYQNFYRRPATAFRHNVPQSSWTTPDDDTASQTPSLGHSSASIQDELSPRTPDSSTTDDAHSVAQSTLSGLACNVNTSFGLSQKAPKLPHGNALPTRCKIISRCQQFVAPRKAEQPSRLQSNAQPIIQETAVRSRMARPSTAYDIDIPTASYIAGKKPAAVAILNSRCHTRRRACAENANAPPKLKRDTDCTDAIVRLIVCFSTKLVHAIWSESASTPRNSSAFNGAGVLPLKVFIQETLRRSKTSYSTLQVALFYLILLKPYIGTYHQGSESSVAGCRALQCGRRMFLTALILASKYLQDRNYSSRAWSKISGLPISEINENERRYLNLIQFNLHMKKEAFENWSKIVLTLCKVGETSMNQDLAKESSGHRSNEMPETTNTASVDEARSGSEQWWLRQLSRLTADLVRDSQKTETYLESLNSEKTTTGLDSERLMASLESPPSSPDSTIDITTDKTLDVVPTEMGSNFGPKVTEFTSSPAPLTALPSRPNLPNLPTPQTTPRFARTLPLPKGTCPSVARCRDSSRALLGLDKQAVNAANLETCPPPQPKVHDLIRYSHYARRDGSSLAQTSSVTSLLSSPESTVSDTSSSSGAPRSRSSSISSTSSIWWPSGAQQCANEGAYRPYVQNKEVIPTWMSMSTILPEANVPASYGFYHSSMPISRVFEDEGVGMGVQMGLRSQTDVRPHRFQDEGYGSDIAGCIEKDSSTTEHEAANGLALLNVCKESRSPSCPAVAEASTEQMSTAVVTQSSVRKHKRDRSSMSEDGLHRHVRNYLWKEQSDVAVAESSMELPLCSDEQLQYPAKGWACPKKPITNGQRTKRFALYHETKSCSSDLASLYLRDDITLVS